MISILIFGNVNHYFFFYQAHERQPFGAYKWVEVATVGCQVSASFVQEISENFETTAQIFRLNVRGTTVPKDATVNDIERRKPQINEILFFIEGSLNIFIIIIYVLFENP